MSEVNKDCDDDLISFNNVLTIASLQETEK